MPLLESDLPLNLFSLEILLNSLTPANKESLKEEGKRIIKFSEIPSSVIMSKSANYVDERVPGRSEPWKTYSESGSTVIDFTVKLVATGASDPKGGRGLGSSVVSAAGQIANRFGVDGLISRAVTIGGALRDTVVQDVVSGKSEFAFGKDAQAIFVEVTRPAFALLALTFPQYDDNGIAYPPPLVNLRHGNNFIIRGIVDNVRFNWMGPWHPTSGLCMQVECQISLKEVNQIPKSFLDVLTQRVAGNGAAGQIQTFVRTPRNLLGQARAAFGL